MESGTVRARVAWGWPVAMLLSVAASGAVSGESPADKLDGLPGFKIEHILKADPKINGSWICMAKDNKGRLLLGGQRNQPVTRVTLKDGQVESQEDIKLPISETMGLLYAHDSLYVSGFGKNKEGKGVFGFFRCRDTQGKDTYDSVEFLREFKGGAGEHGAHGIVLGQDKKLYVVCGNFTGLPDDLLPSSPHRNYADDRVLPRAEDGNGFGAGHKPPGGWIVRMDADGKNAELFASGQRNCYDIAFNADGELFGFDSDMEWDWGMPWYRPVRAFHAVSGGDQGFREGTAKWPEYYPDSVPASVNIGIGCPTGVLFGTGAKFPAKYQKAFYILDWTYGRLIAVHLKPNGAGYNGSWENFVAPKGLKGGPKSPLNLTDAVIGDDGAMYFTIGGRGTGASLFRVTYTGAEATAAANGHDAEGAEARALRHKIEELHAKVDAGVVDTVWPNLSNADRYIRYAARIALERQPVEMWKAKALAEKQPAAALTALLALARLGAKETQVELLQALSKIAMTGLDEAAQLEKIRVLEVSVARQGKPAADAVKDLVSELSAMYPAKSVDLNRELCQTLIALDAPDAVSKTVALLNAAKTQEEQISYVLFLRNASVGWTPDLRKQYFTWWSNKERSKEHPEFAVKWFEDAGRPYGDGASFPKFIGNFFNDAKTALPPEEATALADVLAAYTPPGKPQPKKPTTRKLVKEWAMADLQPALDQVGKGRSFERGKEIYEAAQCAQCHKFGNAGGSVGADLTAIAARFQRRDVLESILEPSKVISEQFQNTTIKTNDGKIVEGRVVDENDARVVVQPNQLLPEKIEVKKDNLKSRGPSKLSPMPEGLVNNFHQDEILDLLAYLEAGGNTKHANFATAGKIADVTARVSAEIKGSKLTITPSNDNFGGDPAPNEVKKFKIDYTIGDEQLSKTVGEGETVEIVAPADKKLFVKRAVYGVLPK